jgi:hypothetical protein
MQTQSVHQRTDSTDSLASLTPELESHGLVTRLRHALVFLLRTRQVHRRCPDGDPGDGRQQRAAQPGTPTLRRLTAKPARQAVVAFASEHLNAMQGLPAGVPSFVGDILKAAQGPLPTCTAAQRRLPPGRSVPGRLCLAGQARPPPRAACGTRSTAAAESSTTNTSQRAMARSNCSTKESSLRNRSVSRKTENRARASALAIRSAAEVSYREQPMKT